MARPDPPYLQIVGELETRIRSGALRPGDRLPSVRQIAMQWGVAIATATRVIATLREAGLADTRVGSGTVVTAQPAGGRPAAPPRSRPAPPGIAPRGRPVPPGVAPVAGSVGASRGAVGRRRARGVSGGPPVLSRERLLRAAVAIADGEGLEAVSMRRVASAVGVGPMSLYRHIANKDELIAQMADQVFGEAQMPDPEPGGWRPRLELIARTQWALCRRHLWLPKAVSFTRPSLAPNMMAHTEWILRALDEVELSPVIRMQEAMTLHAMVITSALSLAEELEAEHESGMTLAHWLVAQRARADELFATGRFPLLAELHENTVPDLDALFDYSLTRHLDGFAVLIDASGGTA